MKFKELLALVGDSPVFSSTVLLAGAVAPPQIQSQLTRWKNSGKILQLRRGLYPIAPLFHRNPPHSFVVANHLQRASYVSLHSALSFYHLIPEVVSVCTSVSTGRPEQVDTPLGRFSFRHIRPQLLFGFQMTDLGSQQAFLATPEKALLDLVYLTPHGDSPAFLQSLRLQHLDFLDPSELKAASRSLWLSENPARCSGN